MALPSSVLKRWQNKRRQAILDIVAKDPCALDVVVWAEAPMVPRMVDCLFEASISCDPPLRWAMCGPEEPELRRTLSRLHASVPDIFIIPQCPVGFNPYLIPIEREEKDVFATLVGRTPVVFDASMNGLPEALREACSASFVDLVDVSAVDMSGPVSQEVVADILNGTPRQRGDIVRLSKGTDATTDFACASDAVAVIKALISTTWHVDEAGIEAALRHGGVGVEARARL
jgi:hypothetical protein